MGGFIPAGSPAPTFRYLAVASEREIKRTNDGRWLVLLFHNQNTLEAARDVNTVLREQFDASQLLIASVVDFSRAPRVLRGTIQRFVAQAYRIGAREVPDDVDPADYVVILPDYTGALSSAFGVKSLRKGAVVAVLDAEGVVRGMQQGDRLGAFALSCIDLDGDDA